MKTRIYDYLQGKDEASVLSDLLGAVLNYSEELDYLRLWDNTGETLEMFFNGDMEKLARSIVDGSYSYMDEVVRLDVYYNLQSLSENELEDELLQNKHEIIEEFIYLVEAGDLNIDDFIK